MCLDFFLFHTWSVIKLWLLLSPPPSPFFIPSCTLILTGVSSPPSPSPPDSNPFIFRLLASICDPANDDRHLQKYWHPQSKCGLVKEHYFNWWSWVEWRSAGQVKTKGSLRQRGWWAWRSLYVFFMPITKIKFSLWIRFHAWTSIPPPTFTVTLLYVISSHRVCVSFCLHCCISRDFSEVSPVLHHCETWCGAVINISQI